MVQKTFIDSSHKFCASCGQTKSVTEFHPSRGTIHGFDTYCKHCRFLKHQKWRLANKAHVAAQQKRWRDENPRVAKDYHLERRYKLPQDGYGKLLFEQNGKCACCGGSDPKSRGDFHVDHCHDTGKIRGLLCGECNSGIGYFRHDINRLQLAIEFLIRTSH